MGLSHSPSIVRDGLVLHLDAANPKSYPGSGTVWRDLSGNVHDCGIVSPLSYESLQNDYFSYANNSGYVNIDPQPLNLSSDKGTIELFFRTSGNNIQSIFHTEENRDRVIYYSDGNLFAGQYNGSTGNFEIVSASINDSWNYAAFTYNLTIANYKLFLNGVFSDEITISGTTDVGSNTPSQLGAARGQDTNVPSRNSYNGDLSVFKIYNRALTEQEVQQNFEALRGRYSI